MCSLTQLPPPCAAWPETPRTLSPLQRSDACSSFFAAKVALHVFQHDKKTAGMSIMHYVEETMCRKTMGIAPEASQFGEMRVSV